MVTSPTNACAVSRTSSPTTKSVVGPGRNARSCAASDGRLTVLWGPRPTCRFNGNSCSGGHRRLVPPADLRDGAPVPNRRTSHRNAGHCWRIARRASSCSGGQARPRMAGSAAATTGRSGRCEARARIRAADVISVSTVRTWATPSPRAARPQPAATIGPLRPAEHRHPRLRPRHRGGTARRGRPDQGKDERNVGYNQAPPSVTALRELGPTQPAR
jgi:hypothetical protein